MEFGDLLTLNLLFATLAGIAAGFVRGFAGFGANLVWAPIMVITYGPVAAVATMSMVGLLGTAQVVIPALRLVNWRDIWPIMIAVFFGAPLGVWALLHLEAEFILRAIGAIIILFAIVLMVGWRYRGVRKGWKGNLVRAIVGGGGGWLNGFGGIGGPLPVLYFMASRDSAEVQRANIGVTVSSLGLMPLIVLGATGNITLQTVILSGVFIIPYMLGILLGSKAFSRLPVAFFKNVVLVLLILIGAAALLL